MKLDCLICNYYVNFQETLLFDNFLIFAFHFLSVF